MEPPWPLVLQEGNMVVCHGYLRVLIFNLPKEDKNTIFPHNLNSPRQERTPEAEGKTQKKDLAPSY